MNTSQLWHRYWCGCCWSLGVEIKVSFREFVNSGMLDMSVGDHRNKWFGYEDSIHFIKCGMVFNVIYHHMWVQHWWLHSQHSTPCPASLLFMLLVLLQFWQSHLLQCLHCQPAAYWQVSIIAALVSSCKKQLDGVCNAYNAINVM